MEKRYYLILIIIAVLGIIFLSGCVTREETTMPPTTQETDLVIAKLISIIGGDFVESAGYYEGKLNLENINTGKEYSIFVCTEDWSWVNQGSCYQFSLSEVERNVESHKYSAELSGCYVGTLQGVNC